MPQHIFNPYNERTFRAPAHLIDMLNQYVEHGRPTGNFLEAIICNDLKGAVGQAGHINIQNIPAFVDYLYNKCPINCWGSKEKMNKWLEMHEKRREKENGQDVENES